MKDFCSSIAGSLLNPSVVLKFTLVQKNIKLSLTIPENDYCLIGNKRQ